METSEDESSRTIDSPCGIAVTRYRLTETDCTLPLYIIHTALPIFPYAMRSTKRVVSLISPEGRDYV